MKLIRQSILCFAVMTVILGGVYPAVVMGIAQTFFHDKANGSFLSVDHQKVGSELIAQEFTQEKFFWARPSAAGYNGSVSTGSNYALINKDHQKAVAERKAQGLDFDLLTTSGSGLDPHITPKAAYLQVPRIAKSRGIDEDALNQMVKDAIEERQFGLLGEERVNVLLLNMKLENIIDER